jgi:FkbM family methyltransferase
MKKIRKWWTPDRRTVNTGMISEERFTCVPSLEKAFKYVKNFNNAIDVGCWIGDSTNIISQAFKTVEGFEANPEVFECCVENLKDRNVLNCKIYNIGLSNQKGKLLFYNGKSHFSGWISGKSTFLETSITNKIEIDATTLDNLNYHQIDFIKIDIDSHEGFLLDGARNFLKDNSPVILIEIKKTVHQDRQLEDMPDPFKILEELGYIMVEKVAKWDFVFIKEELK